MKVRIRPATIADLPAMASIKHDAGMAAWPHILPVPVIQSLPFLERWTAAVSSSDPRASALVADLEGRVVGFAITRPSGDEDAERATGELDGYYTDPRAWGTGAGRALLAAATVALGEAGFRDATLWTAAENHRPRRIYETAGWRVDGADRHRILGDVAFVEVRYRILLADASRPSIQG
ncbi:MAG: GNAT family N-acetyltransferase [Chloroflexota bacterium]|nr:GNAT family N-acetyltransferase [Chloroflexota bacterium]